MLCRCFNSCHQELRKYLQHALQHPTLTRGSMVAELIRHQPSLSSVFEAHCVLSAVGKYPHLLFFFPSFSFAFFFFLSSSFSSCSSCAVVPFFYLIFVVCFFLFCVFLSHATVQQASSTSNPLLAYLSQLMVCVVVFSGAQNPHVKVHFMLSLP